MDTDAYEALDAYLDSLKNFYKDTPDGAEIVADIEARIAELILSTQDNTRVVEKPLMMNIIAQMGSAEDISDQNADRDLQYETPRIPRRLYRDTENAKLGGVCAGIGKYFDIDPVWVRLGLFLPLLLSCFGGIPFLFWFGPLFGNLFRDLPDLLLHHVVRRPGRPQRPPETRNERRKDHRPIHRRGHRRHQQQRTRLESQTDRRRSRVALRKDRADPAEDLRRDPRLRLIMGACALIIGLFAVVIGGPEQIHLSKLADFCSGCRSSESSSS